MFWYFENQSLIEKIHSLSLIITFAHVLIQNLISGNQEGVGRICALRRLNNNKPRQDTIWRIWIEALRHIIYSELYSSSS